jgi:hypothetical protein
LNLPTLSRTEGVRMTVVFRNVFYSIFLTSGVFLSACGLVRHDSTLDRKVLADDLTPAESLAYQLGQKDLSCSDLKTDELSAKNTEGAPQGPVWSNFVIQLSGCGKVRTYKIQCELDGLCFPAK